MRRNASLAFAIAYCAAILVVTLYDKPVSVGETSCTKIVHNYLHASAQAVGVNLQNEHLIACVQHGLEAVARVEFDVHVTGFPTTHEVLSLRFMKTPWSAVDVHQVG